MAANIESGTFLVYHELILTSKEYMSTVTAVDPHVSIHTPLPPSPSPPFPLLTLHTNSGWPNSAAFSTASKKKVTAPKKSESLSTNLTAKWKSRRRWPRTKLASKRQQGLKLKRSLHQ